MNMEISKTDIRTIIKYLGDAAGIYDTLPGQRHACRAWMIRQLMEKLNNKLNKDK